VRTVSRPLAVLALVAAVVVTLALLLPNGDGYRYTLTFQNAGQLVPGNEVLIGGHPVGSVEDINLTDDAMAEIEIKLDQQLHEGTTAVIRSVSLAGIANRYVSISPGPNSADPIDDGGRIGIESTTTPVDLDQVFNAFDRHARNGLSAFIRGQAGVYRNRGYEANRSYKYLEPALSQTNEFLLELNRDQRLFRRFITGSADLFNTIAGRRDDLSQSVTNANQAFTAIANVNESLDASLERLAPTFRQSNTAFVNLRTALDDLDSLVATAKPATADLAPFLAELRPVLADTVPVVRDLRRTAYEPGPANDLGELTAILPEVESRVEAGFRHAAQAIGDFQPTLEFARAYTPEMVNALAKLGQVTAYYDANGHYVRAGIADLNLFRYDEASGTLEPAPGSEQYAPFGSTRISQRCPGGATQPAPDLSNPFYGDLWPESGLDGSECDPTEVPPGP
jgi:phospholipid/cholesterol/gamma-HCH transport system substrate-binding protein